MAERRTRPPRWRRGCARAARCSPAAAGLCGRCSVPHGAGPPDQRHTSASRTCRRRSGGRKVRAAGPGPGCSLRGGSGPGRAGRPGVRQRHWRHSRSFHPRGAGEGLGEQPLFLPRGLCRSARSMGSSRRFGVRSLPVTFPGSARRQTPRSEEGFPRLVSTGPILSQSHLILTPSLCSLPGL